MKKAQTNQGMLGLCAHQEGHNAETHKKTLGALFQEKKIPEIAENRAEKNTRNPEGFISLGL